MSRYAPRRGAPPLLDVLATAQRVAEASDAAFAPAPVAMPKFDAAGRRRTPQQSSEFRRGVAPNNKGKTYKATPPSVAECMAMLNTVPPTVAGSRLYASIVLGWQGAMRAFEVLALTESDLDDQTGAINIRHGKGDKASTISMAAWAWPFLADWRTRRHELPNPTGPLICVVAGPTTGNAWNTSSLRHSLHALAHQAGVRRRCAPHQLRHAWAIQALQAGTSLRAIQLHLRHANIGITDVYFQGLGVDISHEEVFKQSVPMVPATALLAPTPDLAGAR
jgi:integrase